MFTAQEWYPSCLLPEYEPTKADIDFNYSEPDAHEEELQAQDYNEILTFELSIDNSDKLIATSKFTNKSYQVSNWYRRNVISQHTLDCLRWDGSNDSWFNHKDFRQYLKAI